MTKIKTDYVQGLYCPEIKDQALEALNSCIKRAYYPPINDWSEANRWIRKGLSPRPGKHKRETVPYMAEILEQLHPDNPVTHIAVMKSVQSGATHHAECALAYYLAHGLGNVGYYTINLELAKARSSGNIDPLIDDCGLAGMVNPISERNARKRGDSALYKEFDGGIRLIIGSYQSMSGMKSLTLSFIIMDEVDEAPPEIPDQGDTISVLEGRTLAVRNPKLLYLSTPKKEGTSRIHDLYLEGNQCQYEVPCPFCNCFQVLELKRGGGKYGLTFRTEVVAGAKKLIPETVGYKCKGCGKLIRASKKQGMMEAGRWRADNPGASALRRSYHVSGMMASEVFLSWVRLCEQYVLTGFGEDVSRFKDFKISYLGRPWVYRDQEYDWKRLKERADKYCLGDIPEEATPALYAGCDVQADRIECVVMSFGPGFEKWLVDHRVFYGPTNHIDGKVWQDLQSFASHHQYLHQGHRFHIHQLAIDTGYNPAESDPYQEHTVYAFCEDAGGNLFMPVRGVIGRGRKARAELFLPRATGKPLSLNGFALKQDFFQRMGDRYGAGAFHVPRYRQERTARGNRQVLLESFYKGICSEVLRENAKKELEWVKLQRNNELLDCTIYAIGLACYHGVNRWTAEDWSGNMEGLSGD